MARVMKKIIAIGFLAWMFILSYIYWDNVRETVILANMCFAALAAVMIFVYIAIFLVLALIEMD